MKKVLLLLSLLVISITNTFAFTPQTVTLVNNTSCLLEVYLYATTGSSSPCTELMQDLNSIGCTSTPILLGPHSSMMVSNMTTPVPGHWYLNGVPTSAPKASTFYYTAAVVQSSYTRCSSGTFCNSYCGSATEVGIACSGYPTTEHITIPPICCGTTITWSNSATGGSTTVTFN